jgi:hypothetical protein
LPGDPQTLNSQYMAKKNPLGVREKKLSTKEYEDALVKLEKLPADLVGEDEFRARLRQTQVFRYEKGSKMIEDVQSLLISLSRDAPKGKGKELKLAIQKLDDATVQMTHGALKFNKGAVAGVRTLLEIKRG